MKNTNSKKRTIYKPKNTRRVTHRRIYKYLPDFMKGGDAETGETVQVKPDDKTDTNLSDVFTGALNVAKNSADEFFNPKTGESVPASTPEEPASTPEEPAQIFQPDTNNNEYQDKIISEQESHIMDLQSHIQDLKQIINGLIGNQGVQEPEQESITEPQQESVTEPEQESVTEPEQESVSEPEQESVSESVQESVPESDQNTVNGGRTLNNRKQKRATRRKGYKYRQFN